MLHGSETWPVRKENEVALQRAEMRMVRWMCGVKLEDRVPSKGLWEGLGYRGIPVKGQLRWVGHIMRMPDSRIPKQVFCGQLAVGSCPQCGPVRRYKDTVKVNMKKCGMNSSTLGSDSPRLLSMDIPVYWSSHPRFFSINVQSVKQEAQPLSNLGTWPCDHCSRICSSRIGLYTHQLTHRWQGQSICWLQWRSPCVYL